MRNQVFKKLFSVLLTLIMVAGLLPASVLAEGEGNADSTPVPTEAVQPTESAEPTAPTETETPEEPAVTPEATEAPEPTPENPAATVEPTQGEPTAEPTDEGIMPANVMPVQANVAARDTSGDDYYRIVHLDCGREYFSKDWIIALINEMAAAGYNQLQLAFGNGGFRFYLDDMSIDTYSSEAVKSALEYGNKQYNTYGDNGKKDSEWREYNPTTNALTEPEMDAIIAYAKTKSIEIVPMLNTPGHMNALLHAMSKLEIGEYNDLIVSSGCMNLSKDKAVDFTGKLVEKYIKYFKEQEVAFFHLAMDEYHDASGNTSFTSEFFTYANRLIDNVIYAGMTPRVFNDALTSSNNRNSFTAGTQVCCWNSANVSGYSLINTSHDFYYVSTNEAWNLNHSIFNGEGYTFVGDYAEDTWITHAEKFNNNTFLYKKVSSNINPVGSMFCIWCNTPGKNTETQIAQQIRMILRVIGARMQNKNDYSPSDVLVEGGFKADGIINVPTKTVGNGSGNTTADNDTVRVTGPNLAALKCETTTVTIQGAAEGKIAAYDVTPSTADNNKYIGEAEVRIKIPEGWDKTKVKAFIVEDGTAKDIDGTATEDGWYVFTAPHFSVMGIYEKAATTEVGGTIEITKGSTGVITVPGDVTNSVGEIADKTVAEKVEVKPVQQTGETISYSATASTDAGVNGNYVVSNLIDGELNTKYYSGGSQKVGQHVQIDIGAAIQFDTVLVSTPSDSNMNGNTSDYCTNANVMVSVDGENWTTLGQYTGSSNNKTQTYTNSLEKVRYIRVQITTAKNNWWQLAEIQWGSYANGKFTRMAASGSVTTEGKTETQVTIKGIAGGETTIKIDGKTYTIKVVDATLAQQVLPINLWITNTGVVPDGWGTSYNNVTREGFTYGLDTQHTNNGWETFRAIYELKATEDSIHSEQGVKLSELIPNKGKAYGYRGSNTPEEYNVDIWKCSYNASAERQSTDGWTNSSNKGTEFEYIRYWDNKWEYCSAKTGEWTEVGEVGAGKDDSGKNQVCVWYRQVTTVTSEVTTEIVDWGPIKYAANQCLLDFAVKYDGTANRIPNSFPVTGKTIGFDIAPIDNVTYYGTDNGAIYRTVYGIAGVETSNYEVYMITLTPSNDNHSVYINKNSTLTSYNYDGTEKIAWAKTEADANSAELYKMPNVKYGGEPFLESVKIYQYQGLLVTYYLRAKETTDSLTVHYAIDGTNVEFHKYNIIVKANADGTYPTFDENIGLNKTNPKGPLDNGTIVNSTDVTITVSSDLSTLNNLEPQYRYSDYEVVESRRQDGKNVWIYYTFKREHTYVIDFGLPLKIKFSDFGVTNDEAIGTVSLWEKETVLENKGLYGTAKVIMNDTEGKYVLYTLDKPLDQNITIPLYVKFNQRGDNDKPQLFTANIIPATNVYYEDSFAKFTDGSGAAVDAKWTANGKAVNDSPTQALEALGEKTNHKVYGYDPAYDKCTMFSMGSAQKVTVTSDMAKDGVVWPTAQFTFKGTGFDIISLTDNTSGAIFVDVVGKTKGITQKLVVNNYYGYDYDATTGEWKTTDKKNPNTLYQIPVMAVRDLGYDEYNVVISVAYNTFFDKTTKQEYSFWLDAVRVYDPMGKDNAIYNTGNEKEAYPQYIKLRSELKKLNSDGTASSGALFIDGKENANISEYANYGPNNEVYLAKGQAITFKLVGENLSKIATVQIGAKSPNSSAEKTATMKVGADVKQEILGTATEMYYDISAVKDGRIVTITNTGEAILSLTNLKITYTEGNQTVSLGEVSAEQRTQAVQMVRALFAPAPVEPEPEPEPEKTFEPDRFEASWSRNVMQGRKATLTVKTSEDVEAITVDGQTIRSYRTRTERVGFGRRAKRITYREFTYSMVAQESADFSVTAINAEGTESEAITARLTVKTRPNSMRDMWDWFKGWF